MIFYLKRGVLDSQRYLLNNSLKNEDNISLFIIYLNYLGNPALHKVLIVTPTVYPHLDDFYRETNFSTHSVYNYKPS